GAARSRRRRERRRRRRAAVVVQPRRRTRATHHRRRRPADHLEIEYAASVRTALCTGVLGHGPGGWWLVVAGAYAVAVARRDLISQVNYGGLKPSSDSLF